MGFAPLTPAVRSVCEIVLACCWQRNEQPDYFCLCVTALRDNEYALFSMRASTQRRNRRRIAAFFPPDFRIASGFSQAKEPFMRIHLFVRNAFLLLALASPLLIRAQFQQPSSDELKMTADPKTPGAAAVYLNLEEITDDPQHFHSVYARIDMHYADQVNDKVVYRLPAGLAVEGAPQDEKIPWE